jgi:hypothetical protein
MLPSEYQLPDTPKDIPLGSRKSICIHTILFVLTEYLSIFRSPLIGVKRYQFPNSVRYTRRSVLDEHDMITRRVPIARGRGEGEGERRGYYWISFFQLYALPGYPSPSIFPFSIFSIYTWSALSSLSSWPWYIDWFWEARWASLWSQSLTPTNIQASHQISIPRPLHLHLRPVYPLITTFCSILSCK